MRLDHLLSKEFLFWNGKEDRLENSFFDMALSFGKEGRGFLRAWHAVGVLEQRSGPDPINASGYCLWLFVWCGCVGCELYSGREHL